jgi:PhzF family phenazine biosynthesis protein
VHHALAETEWNELWTIQLNARTVTLETTRRAARRYAAELDQGPAVFLGVPNSSACAGIAACFSLAPGDLDAELAPEVVSTGLRYLVIPVRSRALANARIVCPDLGARLEAIGAQFAYLVDAECLEGRHWNNDGRVEDVATGSGAGCVAAYLRRHGRIGDGRPVTLRQGRFLGRPSEITIRAHGEGTDQSVTVGGTVSLVGEGRLDVLPQ